MATINPTLPTPGQPRGSEESDMLNAFNALLAEFNGNVDEANLKTALKQILGVSDGTTPRRGKSIIPGTETRTNVAYGTLPTPDQVTVTLPTDGHIFVAYQATWQESVAQAARAAIFIDANQLTVADMNSAAPLIQEAEIKTRNADASGITISTAGTDRPLATAPMGLASVGGNTAYTGDVTTGQVVGVFGVMNTLSPAGNYYNAARFGVCGPIFAAAGTHVVSVQFKASSGSVTVKNRKLWVKAEGY
jgi:hypothetical protein